MRQQTNIVVSCGEELNLKSHVIVYPKQRDKDEQCFGCSFHVTSQDESISFISIKMDEELDNISWCYHTYFNYWEPQEYKYAKYETPELEEGVKVTVDALKEINLGNNEDLKPTYVNGSLSSNEERAYVYLLKEYNNVFAQSYKEMFGFFWR